MPPLSALAVALAIFAHDKRVTRELSIEPAGDALVVLIHLRVPSGPNKQATLLGVERRHDGVLDDAERKALEVELARRATVGLALMVGSSTVALEGAQLELKCPSEPDLPIDAMLLGRARLDDARLSLATKAGDPVELRLLPGTAPVTSSTRGKVAAGGLVTVLGVPDRVAWRVARE